ncbi:MAG: type IX secretion system membrane protein PorP/SprF [Bacteroidia bacterium]
MKWGLWVCLLLFPLLPFAQQDAQYSQYAFNSLLINPAYAGSREALSMVGLYRNQWLGYEGAPVTTTFSIHAPTADLRHGFGLSLLNDRVGPSNMTSVAGSYAYRIPVSQKGWLAMGLQGELANYRVGYQNLVLDQQGDATLGTASYNRLLPNVGVGAWYNDQRLFAGVSMPRLIRSNLSPAGGDSRRATHAFAMAGYVLPLGKAVRLRPSVMLKWASHAPVSMDFNLAALIQERVWVGASYRTDKSLVLMTQLQITQMLRLGYSYDHGLEQLRRAGSSAHELMLGLDLRRTKNKMVSPRYF